MVKGQIQKDKKIKGGFATAAAIEADIMPFIGDQKLYINTSDLQL